MAIQHTLIWMDYWTISVSFAASTVMEIFDVIMKTVTFKKRRPLVEYRPRLGVLEKLTSLQGYCLQFNLVRGDGVASV